MTIDDDVDDDEIKYRKICENKLFIIIYKLVLVLILILRWKSG